MDNNKFPNGITSYLETHCLISTALGSLIDKEIGFACERYSKQDSGGLYELAKELTDEFEKLHYNEEWIDRDYLEEIDFFIQSK
ncbi:hypothetical protein D1632_00265 [Chryseobacterium nematophagum]|uniref:Uncharacterized protein n=1 Tax=Chryseobacterium nematophagum TaxID=2305228 RepID=A0A3M7LGS5_9FLAO|nr:hypothetical protein [Chryseobacterium nematophagum]RMZ61280.1 hypothetical protein D1632_00265 [Chryseobacterium nematophagum]